MGGLANGAVRELRRVRRVDCWLDTGRTGGVRLAMTRAWEPVQPLTDEPQDRAFWGHRRGVSRPLAPSDVLAGVEAYLGVSREALLGRSRVQHIARARQVAMFLLREEAGLSSPEVGRLLNRDHSTVLYGSGQITRLPLGWAAIEAVRAGQRSSESGRVTISHDCAQVERDALALHAALTEAIRRMSTAVRVLHGPCLTYELGVLANVTLSTFDLLAVLSATTEPVEGVR